MRSLLLLRCMPSRPSDPSDSDDDIATGSAVDGVFFADRGEKWSNMVVWDIASAECCLILDGIIACVQQL